MAIDHDVRHVIGKEAAGDISSYRYYLVKDETFPAVVVCTAASDIPIGALYNEPDADGKAAEVASVTSGVLKVKVGSAGVTAGWVGTKADGLLLNKSSDKDYCIGRVDRSWDSGDIAEVRGAPCFLAA